MKKLNTSNTLLLFVSLLLIVFSSTITIRVAWKISDLLFNPIIIRWESRD